jgi:S-DNA-T family DNA segregation ATPase FtsK/SpoIIIE
VVHYLKDKAKPNYFQSFLNFNSDEDGGEGGTGFGDGDIRRSSGSEDELYDEIKAWVIENNVASTSSLQRHFSIGYGRAASILDALEEEGVIRTVNGNRKEVVRGDNTGTGE